MPEQTKEKKQVTQILHYIKSTNRQHVYGNDVINALYIPKAVIERLEAPRTPYEIVIVIKEGE